MESVRVEDRGGVLVVTPAMKRLDALAAPAFRNQVLERAASARRVVISLGQVRFIDSSGLAAIISVLKRLPPGGDVRLANVGEQPASLLKLTRLDKVLAVFGSVEEAVGEQAPGTSP